MLARVAKTGRAGGGMSKNDGTALEEMPIFLGAKLSRAAGVAAMENSKGKKAAGDGLDISGRGEINLERKLLRFREVTRQRRAARGAKAPAQCLFLVSRQTAGGKGKPPRERHCGVGRFL